MRFAGVIGLAVLTGSVLAGRQAGAASLTAAGCTGPFAQVTSPAPGAFDNVLFATAASGPGDMWAVGRQSITSGYQNLIIFNGGHGWSQVASPNSGKTPNYDWLRSVSASGPSDAWAAGTYATSDPGQPFAPEALHWDGSSWTSVPLPALPGEVNTDPGVGILDISPTDAWLVGSWLRGGIGRSFIAHWNGTAWSLVTHPAVNALTHLAASGPKDVWADGTGAGPSFPAVIEHYNGSRWTRSASLPGIGLNGLTSVSRHQAWAVGSKLGGLPTGNGTVAMEWNGSAWNVVPTPGSSTDGSALRDVTAVPGGGLWAVGSEEDVSTGFGFSEPVAMHWDGTAWTAVPAIGVGGSSGGFTGTLTGVVAPTASRVVAVGWGATQRVSLVANLCPFTVSDTGIAPATAQTSGPGAAAYWEIPASDKTGHELVDGSGFGLFDSGPKAPGSSYAFAFPASGTYTVTDRSDGATEKVRVPILNWNSSGSRTELQWADAAPPAGAHFEVQMMAPGSTRFVHFKDTTKAIGGVGRHLPAGTYKFRSRMRNPASGVTTGWSPVLTVTLS
jgi:hypothetical protein